MSTGGDDPVDRLHESRAINVDEFDEWVREEATVIKEHLGTGTFDNEGRAVGLEHEFYAVDERSHSVRRAPESLLACLGFERELGLHMVELNTNPQPCNAWGIEALLAESRSKLQALQERAGTEQIRIVSDGTWTIGPEHNSTENYLTEATREAGLTLGINVSNGFRYHGFASGHRALNGSVDLPGATIDSDTTGPATLTLSIQPHYQFRSAEALPDHHGNALRIAGPLLALAANSPFLPPGLYDAAEPGRELLLEDGWTEHRIPIQEDVMNPVDGSAKVRFPADVETPAEAVDRIVEDHTIVPAEIDGGGRFDGAFAHFRHKHGTHWRWIRPVFEGATEATANVRIEFRPIPAQPTIPDTVAIVAAFAGLMRALYEDEHPASELAWSTARDNFYGAARDGLDAELTWETADGERTTDSELLFADLLDTATDGLRQHGLAGEQAREWIDPLRARVDTGQTAAGWKRSVVASALEDGRPASEAIETMQRRYIEQQAETLYAGHVSDWPVP